MPAVNAVHVIDSHTEGEPTRVILDGAPDLGTGSMKDRLHRLRADYDSLRTAVVLEPRGSDIVVGALLQQPVDPGAAAGVIFFNDVGYLGMCGHGTIGVVRTLAHLGRIAAGEHRIETPVGTVTACLHEDGSVTVRNLPAYRLHAGIAVDVPGYGRVTGDVAWGGNVFFLTKDTPCALDARNVRTLLQYTTAIRTALLAAGVRGDDDAEVDHIELFAPPRNAANSSRNFVLCPGAAFDRSPCGTGTSAKMACLYADGELAPGAIWRQESILGTVFEGTISVDAQGAITPSIRGRAWITAESKLLFAGDDPCRDGVRF